MDEKQIERAYRHADRSHYQPWCGPQPDEAMMDREDGATPDSGRVAAQEALLCYVFAAGAENWHGVALRSLAAIRDRSPGLHVRLGERYGAESIRILAGVLASVYPAAAPHPGDMPEALLSADRAVLSRILEWIFPTDLTDVTAASSGPLAVREDWLRDGCRRIYLLAMAFRPDLLPPGAGYHTLAVIFGEIAAGPSDTASRRARSRWSARARLLLRDPLRAAGGAVPAMFGKGAAVREKYRESARGNSNRKKGGGKQSHLTKQT